ncbi:MAG: Twin-arginine translocation pathway signal [Noviherbaspirillum sp.]|nr:Twin-arginine translocation pathway signal [Noviherbaspirillum sp.]
MATVAALALGAMAFSAAHAQTYPTQTIKLIVPYTPGTGIDAIARTVGPKLAQRLGQPVVVENRAGASGNIGAEMVAKSAPDGHTLMVNAKTLAVAPHLYRSLSYNPLKDFAPITLAAYGTLLLVTHPNSGISSVAELVKTAKANPDKLTYSSAGIATSQHMSMELIKDIANIQLLHVPYKGSAGALTDLLAGQVSVSLVPVHVVMPHVKSGKLRALAVASPRRHVKAPQVPTLQEQGISGADADIWYGFWAPKGTPAPIMERLNTELRAILAQPDVKTALETQGLDVATSTPNELQAIVQRDSISAEHIIRKNNISID